MEETKEEKKDDLDKSNKKEVHAVDQTELYEEEDEMITTNLVAPENPALEHHIDIIQGNPIPENHPHLHTLTFPTLFPYGVADMFDPDQKMGQTMHERKALKKLMYKAQIVDGKLRFPFQEDDKYMYWNYNKIVRAEA